VLPLLESYMLTSSLSIVLLPSCSDAVTMPVFPQPAYDRKLFRTMSPDVMDVRVLYAPSTPLTDTCT
jgi:hypothetical protein